MQRRTASRAIPERKTVADMVSAELQRMIIEGDFHPGEPLPSQRELAERLGTSRTSVREAVSALSAAGLVQVEHGRGVFVRSRSAAPLPERPISWSFDGTLALRDAYQIRSLIEPYAVRLVTPLASRDMLARLSEALRNMEVSLAAGDLVAVAKEDFAFHWTFVELSGNQLFCDILARCVSLLPTSQSVSDSVTLVEHTAIFNEVAAGRADAAAEAMYRHVAAAATRAQIALPAMSLFASHAPTASTAEVADAPTGMRSRTAR